MSAPQPREARTGKYTHKTESPPEFSLGHQWGPRELGVRAAPAVGNTILPKPHRGGGYDRVERHPDGTTRFYRGDLLHRTDGAAVFNSDGSREFYQAGQPHRDGAPAVILPGEPAKWYQSGREVTSPIPASPTFIHGPVITETVGALVKDGAKYKAICSGMRYHIQYATRLGVLPETTLAVLRYDIDTAHVYATLNGVGEDTASARDTLLRIGNAFRRTSINRDTGTVASNFTLVVEVNP